MYECNATFAIIHTKRDIFISFSRQNRRAMRAYIPTIHIHDLSTIAVTSITAKVLLKNIQIQTFQFDSFYFNGEPYSRFAT